MLRRVVKRQKKKSQAGQKEEYATVENTDTVISQLVSVDDLKRDPRYLFLSLTTFFKIWFSLRLVKHCEGIGSFFFMSYADTILTQVADQVMYQYREIISNHQTIIEDQMEDIDLESVVKIGGNDKDMPVTINLVMNTSDNDPIDNRNRN